MRSVVGGIALGNIVVIVEPVDLLDQFWGLGSETDWGDVEVLEAFVVWVDNQLLRLQSHELWVQPRAE